MSGADWAASSPSAARVAACRRWRRVRIGSIIVAREARGRFLPDSAPRGTSVTLWQALNARVGPRRLLRLMSFYPPYLGAGIAITEVAEDLRAITVQMSLRPWTRNYMGTHFGGSLYAMCDPFFMFMVTQAVGPEYVVWDKAATIDFLKPGRGRVTAR